MGKFRWIFLAIAFLLGQAGLANAADLGTYKPSIIEVPAPAPYDSAWYLKGFIGITNQEVDGFTNDVIAANPFTIVDHEFDSAGLFGLGLGYQHSPWLRFDVTGEYRSKASFNGLDFFTNCSLGSGTCTNEYNGFKSEWLFLANAYWDIGTWKGVTPYVGGGIGTAGITLHDFKDINQIAGGLHWAKDNTEWDFAWALQAGLAYDVAPNFTIDLGYRYVDLGDAKTGTFRTFNSVSSPSPLELHDITSHDLMLGVRWKFGESEACCASYKY